MPRHAGVTTQKVFGRPTQYTSSCTGKKAFFEHFRACFERFAAEIFQAFSETKCHLLNDVRFQQFKHFFG